MQTLSNKKLYQNTLNDTSPDAVFHAESEYVLSFAKDGLQAQEKPKKNTFFGNSAVRVGNVRVILCEEDDSMKVSAFLLHGKPWEAHYTEHSLYNSSFGKKECSFFHSLETFGKSLFLATNSSAL